MTTVSQVIRGSGYEAFRRAQRSENVVDGNTVIINGRTMHVYREHYLEDPNLNAHYERLDTMIGNQPWELRIPA